jgi:hypothetical protein
MVVLSDRERKPRRWLQCDANPPATWLAHAPADPFTDLRGAPTMSTQLSSLLAPYVQYERLRAAEEQRRRNDLRRRDEQRRHNRA